MLEIILIYTLLIFFLFIIFLLIFKQKKLNHKYYYTFTLFTLWKYRLKTMSFVDNKYVRNIELKIKRIQEQLSNKTERISKLEDLIYGSGKRFGGIQLPPLDLTNSGIFSLK